MVDTYRAPDWDTYRMDYKNPFNGIEPVEQGLAPGEGFQIHRDLPRK